MPGSEEVARNLDAWAERVYAAVLALVKRHERDIEGWMKENAPWEDRTGNARQGLVAYTRMGGEGISLYMAHTVDYGVYLELRQGKGRRPILVPARDEVAPKIVEDLQQLLE